MKKKSRVKKGAFDWVDRSTDKQGATTQNNLSAQSKRLSNSSDQKNQAASVEITAGAATIEKKRSIFVAFIEGSGEIIATQELIDVNINEISWPGLPDNISSAAFELAGELEGKEIIDIHRDYKIVDGNLVEKNE